MLELLAAIQSADPPSLVLWGLFVLAAGMYPVGMMLGSDCSACCGCAACDTGVLPPTLTLTLDGFTEQTAGPDLITLTFSSCFGGGAAGRVTAPGGDRDTDKGPISTVTLTNPGMGYAQLGRVAPTITLGGGGGTGATFTPTLAKTDDACGIPTWSITSVSTSGGTGYEDGEPLTVSIASGDAELAPASLRVTTTRTAPTITASASGGSGATLTVTTESNYYPPNTWGVSGVSVSGATSGYADKTTVDITAGTGVVTEYPAIAQVRTVRVQPNATLSVNGPGTGAVLAATLSLIEDPAEWMPTRDAWEVSSIAITNGGSGYSENDLIDITTDGSSSPWASFSAWVSGVDGSGAVTAVTIASGGAFFKSTGEISDVQIFDGGAYYHDDGVPTSVVVEEGGTYYREDASEPPYVASVTATISQKWPSDGAGGSIVGVVDDDPESETFGQLAGLTISSAGDDYLAYEWITNCMARFDGRSLVLLRNSNPAPMYAGGASPCEYVFQCKSDGLCTVERETVVLEYRGQSLPPVLRMRIGNLGYSYPTPDPIFFPVSNASMVADSLVADCSQFGSTEEPLTFTPTGGLPEGATASVVPGGDYDPPETCATFYQSMLNGVKATIEWDGQTWEVAVGNPPADPENRRCDESYALANETGCGLSTMVQYFIAGKCGDNEYLSNTGLGLHVTFRECRAVWGFNILLVRAASNFVLIGGYVFENAEPIPVDEEGYPSGTVALRTNEAPIAGVPTTASVTFSRVLP